MKQTARIISTYSADVMGVCSALFELGGMVVMHDASGCNSTYTTHDEPRWYDMDSMIYISGLSEMEAIMGDDEKLIGDICDAAESLHPEFIAIAGSPIPAMTGFDYAAAAEVVEMRTGIPCYGFPTTGMNTYIHGASMALAGIAGRMVRDPSPDELALPLGMIRKSASGTNPRLLSSIRVNIIGLTPLDFSINGTDGSLAKWLTDNGMEVTSRWAMGSSLEEIRSSGKADVNLVVSAAGIGAAEVLYEKFDIPYVAGMPIGDKQSAMLVAALENAALRSRAARYASRKSAGGSSNGAAPGAGADKAGVVLKGRMNRPESTAHDRAATAAVIGEGITSLALATAIQLETGRCTKVLCATECPDGILGSADRMTPDEDDIIPELEGVEIIIADPMYQPICPPDAKFIALPSEAFSGRLYRDDIPDLIKDPGAILGQI